MSDFATLAYLDFHQLVNRLRTILHQPSRMIVYVVAIGYFGFLAWVRTLHPRAGNYGTTIPTIIPEPYASAILFAFVTLLGVIMYGAASGFLGVFSSTADARFLCGSKLSERAVVTWLQVRRCASAVVRWILLLVFYSLIYHRAGGFSSLAPSLIAGALLTVATAIPILKLRTTRGRGTAQLFSAAIIAAGLLPLSILLASILGAGLIPWARHIESIGAGFAVNALFSRNVWGVSAMYAAAAGLLAFSYAVGNDLYPDLYASSLKVQAFKRQRRHLPGMATDREYRANAASGKWLLDRARGAWTIAWKEWIAFVRAPGAQRMFWFGFIASAAVGVVLGTAAKRSGDPMGTAAVMGGSIANVIVIFITIASSFGLAEDLRKPLWWMGTDTVFSRLVAWILATPWRLSACFAAGILTFSAALGFRPVVVFAIPIAITIAVVLRSIGLALYALMPSGLDQRGPLAMLRVLLTYLCATPPIGATLLAALAVHSFAFAVGAGIVVALLEALVLIAFAAFRVSGRGAAFAQAEAA